LVTGKIMATIMVSGGLNVRICLFSLLLIWINPLDATYLQQQEDVEVPEVMALDRAEA
jgi:hypothetical protein